MAVPQEITSWEDPRLDDYRNLKERQLDAAGGKFIAESERVVRKLVESDLQVVSILVTAPRLASLRPALSRSCPVYLASQELLDRVAGFHVHRGCLAVGVRPPAPSLPASPRLVVAAEDLVDVDNLGSLVRNATAFGADALLLSPRCADPYYRKAVRVAAGNTFFLPVLRLASWPGGLREVAADHRMTIIGAVCSASARPLHSLAVPERAIVLVGSEGPGLSGAAREICDELVTIPMRGGADSLNVATAAAVFLHHLTP